MFRSTSRAKKLMNYQAQLTPWVVYKVTESTQIEVIRYRRRNDADAYAKRLSRTQPTSRFIVAFDTESFPTVNDKDHSLATV